MKLRHWGVLGLFLAVMACEPAARKADIARGPQSSTVAVRGGTAVAVDADHDAIVFVDLAGGARQSVSVGRSPAQLAVRGNLVAVTNKLGRTLSVVDADARQVLRTIPVGIEPHGVAFVDDQRVALTLGGEQKLAVVNVVEGIVERTMDLPADRPRSVVVVGDDVYVSHMIRGVLSRVDLRSGSVRGVPINLDVSGVQLNGSLVSNLAASPDNNEVSTGNVNLNNEGIQPAPQDTGGGGYLGSPGQLPAVNPTLTTVDTRTGVMTSHANPEDAFGGRMDCFDCGGTGTAPSTQPSALLSPFNGVIPPDMQLNEPVATAYLDGGRGIAVLARGSRNVFIWRRDTATGQRRELLQVTDVGHGADGLAGTADGKQLVVHNAFDLTLSLVDIPDLEDKRAARDSILSGGSSTPTTIAAPTRNSSRALKFAEVTLDADVAAGRRLFHDATLPGMTQGPGITCGTCHAEGRNDNRTWAFIDGPRNTPNLAGASENRRGIATTTEPLHWRGELTTHLDLQRTVTEFMGGGGLTTQQLDQVAAFIDTLMAPDVPDAVDDAELGLRIRGEEIFNSAAVGCTECHNGEHFTDNRNHEVGTGNGMPIDRPDTGAGMGFQTPVLHGLRYSAPYLHDGSAPTLEVLVEDMVRTGRMGHGESLTDADAAALVAYLKSI